MKPERVFFAISVAFGTIFTFLTPPFQVPDEAMHFYRAYSIAQGALIAEVDRGRIGDELPVSVIRSSNRFTRALSGKPEATIDLTTLGHEMDRPLLPVERYFEPFPATASYSPVGYLVPVAAIAIAASADASPIEVLYAARLANVLITSLLLAMAIAISPILRWQLALLALLPMNVFLRASISVDAVTTAIAFLAIASILRMAFGPEDRVRHTDAATFVAAMFLLPLAKPLYACLVAVAAIVPPRRIARAWIFYAAAVTAAAAGAAMTLPWSAAASGTEPAPQAPNVTRQLALAAAEPLRVAGVVGRDLIAHGPRYMAHFIGHLGTLDTPLPLPLLGAYTLALAAMLLAADGNPARWQRAMAGALFLILSAGLAFALYLAWTPVGARSIEGIQGRYFAPFSPLLFVAFASARGSRWTGAPWFPRAFGAFTAAGLACTTGVLVARYYV